MSAAMATPRSELRLEGKPPFSRLLKLDLSEHGRLFAMVYVSGSSQMIVYAHAPFADCRLDLHPDGDCLWLLSTALDVSPEEAQIIRATLEPRGLSISQPTGDA